MAAAALTRTLLHRTTTLPYFSATIPKPSNHTLHVPEPRPLQLIKTPLLNFCTFNRLQAAAFSDTEPATDEDDYEEEEGGDEEEGPDEEGEVHEQQASPSPKTSAPLGGERRLYVGNLPYSMTSAQIGEVFSEAGTVDSVEIVYDRVTNRSRGFGFVTMGSPDEASAAIRMFNGAQVGGRTVKVNLPEVPKGQEREVIGPRARRGSPGFTDSPYKVYAGNLGWTVTSESLREAFAAQPGLLGTKVVYNRDSGLSRGFGFLSFGSAEEAESAINAMNGKEVEGRPLRLSISSSQGSTSREPREQLSAVESY